MYKRQILVVCGGVIPPEDYPALREAGAAAIFGPGTVVAVAARSLIELLDAKSDTILPPEPL